MIPVDAQIWTEADVRRDGFSLETVLGEINSRGAGVKIALIDASRRNPFERRFRSFSAGLAPVIAPNGTLVMYSAALSSVISDNGSDHSLFVRELLKEIRVPDLMAEETLNRTRVGVTRASRSEQVPWISSSLAEDFSFSPGRSAAVEPASSGTAAGADHHGRLPHHPPAQTTAAASAATAAGAPSSPDRRRAISARTTSDTATAAAKAGRNRHSGSDADGQACGYAGRRSDHQEPDRKSSPTIRTSGSALYRRGQVYASKGAYDLGDQGFRQFAAAEPQGRRGL